MKKLSIIIIFPCFIFISCAGTASVNDNNVQNKTVKEINIEQTGDHTCGMPCYNCHHLRAVSIQPGDPFSCDRPPLKDLQKGNTYSNLICYVVSGDTVGLKKLIDAGADVNFKDHEGASPLSVASCFGYMDIVKLLIEAGADVNIKSKHGGTPLMGAAFNNKIGVVKKLIDAGADVNIANDAGHTALSFAKYCKCDDSIKLLEEAGAKPSKPFVLLYW